MDENSRNVTATPEQIQKVFEMAGLGTQAERDRFKAFAAEPEPTPRSNIRLRFSDSTA